MKKLLTVFTCLLLLISLASCSGGSGEQSSPDRPPAFSVLQRQSKLTKHSEQGESAAFSRDEFRNFLGEELSRITVTVLPDAGSGTLIFNGKAVMQGQTLPAEQLEFLKFVPAGECKSASFGFTCDSAGYFGNELCCEMIFGDEVNSPPIVSDSFLKTVEGISCEGKLKIVEPNGDDYTVNVITYPADGFISIDARGAVVYTPEEGFSGSDQMVYTVTDRFGAVSSGATLSIEVAENESGLHFADMQEDPMHLYAHRMCANNTMVYRCEDGNYYFDPETPVSKIEFLVMLMTAANLDSDITAVADSVAADDSALSSGMKGYLSAAHEKGLIVLDDGNFSPESEITVAEAAYMIVSALKLPQVVAGSASAEDADADSDYFSVTAAVSAGIIETEDGSVNIDAVLTKADAALLLCRVEDYMTANNMN